MNRQSWPRWPPRSSSTATTIHTAIRNGAIRPSSRDCKPADLKRFYETQVRPEQAAVIAVGDIALDELKQQLEESLGTWKSASSAAARSRFRLASAEADGAWC